MPRVNVGRSRRRSPLHLEDLLNLDSKDPHAIKRLGKLCMLPETAERAKTKLGALSTGPNAPSIVFTLSGDLQAMAGNYTAAANFYDMAISINGKDIIALNNLAQSLILLDPPQPRLWRVLGETGPRGAAESVGLYELTPGRPALRRIMACLADGLADELGCERVSAPLSRAESRAAGGLRGEYADPAFTRRR